MRKVLSRIFSRSPNPSRDTVTTTRDTTTSIAQDPPLLDDIPANILAFRTITKLLSLIQQERAIKASEKRFEDARQRRELQIINALATLAVIEHEVVAVVNNLDSSVLDPELDTPNRNLNLIAVVEPSQDENQDITPPKPPGQPIITSVEVLASLNLANDEAIKKYTDQYWSDMTMAKHLWITSKLLSMKAPVTDNETEPGDNWAALMQRLQCHVIATCCPKIARRLRLSASDFFINSLESVKDWEFDEDQRSEPSAKEIANDAEVAALLLEESSVVNFPNLLEQAKLIENQIDKRLYTKETCLEFHIMLLSRIDDFKQSLFSVESFKRTANPPTEGPPDFQEAVLQAAMSGSMLQQLTKGAALKMHLKTIAPLLKRNDRTPLSMPFGLYAKPNKQQGPAKIPEERDEEIEVVCESVKKGNSLAVDYLDWLKLLVTHFDAISILVNYVTGPEFKHDGISIEIVVPPPLVQGILPWQSLLSDSTLFPTLSAPSLNVIVTNAKIKEYLDEALLIFPQFELAQKAWNDGDKAATINCFEELKEAKVKSWVMWAEAMIAKLKGNNSPYVWSNDGSDTWAKGIATEIEASRKSTAFFAALANNKDFGGTMHCEACLASLLTEGSLVSKDILARMKGFGPVIGISKRCCPVCRFLLVFLLENKEPFIVRGFYNTVSACTLPTWLPKKIVDSMNFHFGSQLRQELVELMYRTEL